MKVLNILDSVPNIRDMIFGKGRYFEDFYRCSSCRIDRNFEFVNNHFFKCSRRNVNVKLFYQLLSNHISDFDDLNFFKYESYFHEPSASFTGIFPTSIHKIGKFKQSISLQILIFRVFDTFLDLVVPFKRSELWHFFFCYDT